MNANDESRNRQYVVYTLDEDANATHFLAVEDNSDDAEETMNKWWKAFRSGEKQKPRDYGGVSFSHVAEWERWEDG